MNEDKNYKTKGIKFFLANDDDMEIYRYFNDKENKTPKFATIVKKLLLNYIRGDGEKVRSGDEQLTKEEVSKMINKAIEEYASKHKSSNDEKEAVVKSIKDEISAEKLEDKSISTDKKTEKKNKNKGLLNQIKNNKN